MKIVEMEERLAKGQANRLAETEAMLFKRYSESMREIDALKREVKSLKEASAFPNTFIDPPLSRESRRSPQVAHTAGEIRDLIHQNGHRLVVSEPFTCIQYAAALEKIVELRPGDRVMQQKGRTVFQKRVQATMSDWVNNDKAGKSFYSNCPFARFATYEYGIKEAWQWHNQAA
jgi:hypothetical protein